jgi:hypothetical protein
MLDHLRQKIVEAILSTHSATLATYGPAGLQASQLPCESIGLRFFMLLPATSDHLLNLETRPEVTVNTARWQLRGTAAILENENYPLVLGLRSKPEAQWGRLVEIFPTQFNLRRTDGLDFSETIDVDYLLDESGR